MQHQNERWQSPHGLTQSRVQARVACAYRTSCRPHLLVAVYHSGNLCGQLPWRQRRSASAHPDRIGDQTMPSAVAPLVGHGNSGRRWPTTRMPTASSRSTEEPPMTPAAPVTTAVRQRQRRFTPALNPVRATIRVHHEQLDVSPEARTSSRQRSRTAASVCSIL